MNRPRKSIAELLAERQAAASEAKPIDPPAPINLRSPREPEPDLEAIEPVPVAPDLPAPQLNANESIARPARLPPRPFNPIPLNDVCGARTRRGTLCQSRELYRSGRCKHHGGMSTGPNSAAGKARVAMNGRAPKKAKPMGTTENLGSDLTKPDIDVEGC